MFRYVVIASCIVLAGCGTVGTTNVIQRQAIVVKPSPALYKCDTAKLPNPDTLTDKQVAQVIKDLVRSNAECKRSLKAINAFIEGADGIVVDQTIIDQIRRAAKAS
jgi:hypothetical protein